MTKASADDRQTVFARVPTEVYAWLMDEAQEEAARTGNRPMVGSAVRVILMRAYRDSKANGKKGK